MFYTGTFYISYISRTWSASSTATSCSKVVLYQRCFVYHRKPQQTAKVKIDI